MKNFRFRLNKTEEQFRNNIDSVMMYDRPETFLFFKNYGKGLSFIENNELIKGVYLNSSDKAHDGFRNGSSIRVRFHGKIIRNDEGYFFTGWIYPDPLTFLIILYTFFAFMFNSESIAFMIFPAVVTAMFIAGFISLTKKCFSELSFMASGE